MYLCSVELDERDIIIDYNLERMADESMGNYVTHAFCEEGRCAVTFNGQTFTIEAGDCMIIVSNRLVSKVEATDDFRVEVVYVENGFVQVCTPHSNYGTRGSLSLYINPIMRLTEDEQAICRRSFDNVCHRMQHPHRHFHTEEMVAALQQLFVDFFECHARIEGEVEVTTQAAQVMERFVALLEGGNYKENREVSYYAEKLCVTPKYLSEICKKVSGFSANVWINRYASLELAQLLKDKSLTLNEIADRFHFSSASHFSRYVQNNLGQKPSAFR